MSDGWAPLSSHAFARSASTTNSVGSRARVVVAEGLERPPVTGATAVGDDDAIARLLVRADAREPDANCHEWWCSSLVDAGTGRPDLSGR